MNITFNLTGNLLSRTDTNVITPNMSEDVIASITYDNTWKTPLKAKIQSDIYTYEVDIVNNKFTLPKAVVSVFGFKITIVDDTHQSITLFQPIGLQPKSSGGGTTYEYISEDTKGVNISNDLNVDGKVYAKNGFLGQATGADFAKNANYAVIATTATNVATLTNDDTESNANVAFTIGDKSYKKTITTNIDDIKNTDAGDNANVEFSIGDKSYSKTINNVKNATTATTATQDTSGNKFIGKEYKRIYHTNEPRSTDLNELYHLDDSSETESDNGYYGIYKNYSNTPSELSQTFGYHQLKITQGFGIDETTSKSYLMTYQEITDTMNGNVYGRATDPYDSDTTSVTWSEWKLKNSASIQYLIASPSVSNAFGRMSLNDNLKQGEFDILFLSGQSTITYDFTLPYGISYKYIFANSVTPALSSVDGSKVEFWLTNYTITYSSSAYHLKLTFAFAKNNAVTTSDTNYTFIVPYGIY